MGWLAALLSLGFTLLGGGLFIAVGGGLAAAALLFQVKRKSRQSLASRPLWKLSSLAFLAGLLLGSFLQLSIGGPSPVTSAIGVPLFVIVYTLLLRFRMAEPFAKEGWLWHTPVMAFVSSAFALMAMTLLMAVLKFLV